ncbi:MAG: hypothetical protein QNK30_05185 [Bacteroidales bacterium]|nr:hypothetical protein [Bacteroidales bacterium]
MKKRKKNKVINSFHDLRLAKEQARVDIIKNEYSIKDSHRNILASITPVNIFNSLIETLVSKPNVAIKAGFIIGSLIKGRHKNRKNKSR